MAAAYPKVPLEDCTSDLTKCGICKETVNDPKALQCLHTFCLVCLKEWISGDKSSNTKFVVCPACKKPTPLSADEIEGLPGNFFVSSLMERSRILTPETNTACICCEETGAELLATCAICEGFLCKKGMDSHKTLKFLKTHDVLRLEDLQARFQTGVITNVGSILPKQPFCDAHKGQPLWLYCETCSELICGNCTFVKHKSPEHVYVELESIATDQRRDIQQLVEKTSQINTKIRDILQNTKSTRDSLSSSAKQVALAIKKTGQTAIDQIHKLVKAEQDKLDEWVSKSEKKLTNTEEKLLSQQSQIQRCEEMANQVLKTGSDYDVASIYNQLVNSLQEANNAEYSGLEPGLDKVMFEPSRASTDIKSLGNLTFGVRKVSSRKWELGNTIINGQDGRFNDPMGVTVTPSGDIAVANWEVFGQNPTPVQIYSKSGSFKKSLCEESTDAWNVTSMNDRLFVTRCYKKHVATFNSDGKYLSEFPTVSSNGIKSYDMDSTDLRGLASDHQNTLLLVGENNSKYISIHTCDGSHVRSVKSLIKPYYICTTTQGNIIVSDGAKYGLEGNVHVMDMYGNQLTEIKPPQSVASWRPYGICVSQNDEICIADWKNSSIYCFTQRGQYLSCICKELTLPRGIALMENDTKLIVAEGQINVIKIFTVT